MVNPPFTKHYSALGYPSARPVRSNPPGELEQDSQEDSQEATWMSIWCPGDDPGYKEWLLNGYFIVT